MTRPPKKKSRWRWLRRALLTLLLLACVAVSVPFLFTTVLVRWLVARSSYARFSPQFSSASLDIEGKLTLHDLVLHELPPANAKPLLQVKMLQVTFRFSGLANSTLKTVFIDQLTLFLRPGEAPNTLAPTLLQLVTSPASPSSTMPASTTPATSPASPPLPLWFDSLMCAGSIDLTGYPAVSVGQDHLPFLLKMEMRGRREDPTRDLFLHLGPQTGGDVTIDGTLEPRPIGRQLQIDLLAFNPIAVHLDQQAVSSLFPQLPENLRRPLTIKCDAFNAGGTFETAAGVLTAKNALLDLEHLDLDLGGSDALALKNLTLDASLDGPLLPDANKAIGKATLSFDALSYGQNHIAGFSTPIALRNAQLNASSLRWSFDDGQFTGSLHYALSPPHALTADINFQHLDQQKLTATLAPDKFTAEGDVSGSIHLAMSTAHPPRPLSGSIDIHADEPGHLHINDKQAAQAIAEKLNTGNGAPFLPPNFSDIVVKQLENYPYDTGHVQISAPDGVPAITLTYHRPPLAPGEPGYGIRTTIAGHEVLANYNVQLPGLTLLLKGQTIQQLLALATGLQQELTGKPPGK